MQAYTISYLGSTIHYYQFGNGPTPVICFHGYGEEAKSFLFLEKHAGNQYSFFAIDIPFHGETDWKEGINMSIVDLQKIVYTILEMHQHLYKDHQVILLGYSLGGRVALRLFEAAPEKVQRLVLIAPDGLVLNPWYWFSTQTSMGNRIFRYTMRNPKWFFSMLNGIQKMGLVNPSVFKFVNHYNYDEEARHLLYIRWTSLRKIRPNLQRIKALIRKNNTPVRIIYGRHDRIILPVRGDLFQKNIEPWCHIKTLNSGHQLLVEKFAAEIMNALSK